ncbi:Photosystem I assembly protein Ycf3 [Pseudodesulfovibrio hydrargyri]|uniref:Photosystem I assembly protein Ycf3 n=1 Tax=Pseudodesulfovibrio hydrargyri TaxID=2125990 RepID=A0A1J5NDM4_9BACT|nr:tetratricopeptide repeat protein [Pseudodesulfovibrio hydrargyri]OIQ51311.1 Photosystem I assembly protein Ycf3 [Pseudodesulfovibrio hydrargyri]
MQLGIRILFVIVMSTMLFGLCQSATSAPHTPRTIHEEIQLLKNEDIALSCKIATLKTDSSADSRILSMQIQILESHAVWTAAIVSTILALLSILGFKHIKALMTKRIESQLDESVRNAEFYFLNKLSAMEQDVSILKNKAEQDIIWLKKRALEESANIKKGNASSPEILEEYSERIANVKDKDSMTAEDWYLIGRAHQLKNNFAEAVAAYDNALKIDSNFKEVLLERGNCKADLGDQAGAIDDYSLLIKQEPGYAWAYNNRGIIYLTKSEYDLAIKDFQKALEICPDLTQAEINLAESYLIKGCPEKAISTLLDMNLKSANSMYIDQANYIKWLAESKIGTDRDQLITHLSSLASASFINWDFTIIDAWLEETDIPSQTKEDIRKNQIRLSSDRQTK